MDGLAIDRKASTRRDRAIAGARSAVDYLRTVGVEAKIIGSLAKGTFGLHSDVDLLIVSCPRHLKYAIEGRVEETLRGIPFDVVYLDEIPTRKLARFAEGAIDASDLR